MLKRHFKLIFILLFLVVFIITGCTKDDSKDNDLEKVDGDDVLEEIEISPIGNDNSFYDGIEFKDGKTFSETVKDELVRWYVDKKNDATLKIMGENVNFYFDLIDDKNILYSRVGIDDSYIYFWDNNDYLTYSYENNKLSFRINDVEYTFSSESEDVVTSYRENYFANMEEVKIEYILDETLIGHWYSKDDFMGIIFDESVMRIDFLKDSTFSDYKTDGFFIYGKNDSLYSYSVDENILTFKSYQTGVEVTFEKMDESSYYDSMDKALEELDIEVIVEEETIIED